MFTGVPKPFFTADFENVIRFDRLTPVLSYSLFNLQENVFSLKYLQNFQCYGKTNSVFVIYAS